MKVLFGVLALEQIRVAQIDEVADSVTILAVWGAVRGRGPTLAKADG